MTGSDIALVIAAIGGAGGVVTAVGNVILQIMTLKQTQANARNIESNTHISENARASAEDAAHGAARAAAKAAEVGAVNAVAMANVASTLETVRAVTNGQSEKLVAAALAQGQAEGHLAGVAAEQQRVAATTGQFRALEKP